jgi:hypothetical protein
MSGSRSWIYGSAALHGITNFAYGALGGGGYSFEVSFAPDGSSLLVKANLPNSFQWRRSGDTVINLSKSPYMDGLQVGPGQIGSPYSHAYGPDSQRIYLSTGTIPNRLLTGNVGSTIGQLYRSDDGGNTWVKPGPGGTVSPTGTLTQPLSIAGGNMYMGPPMMVDPLNKDILWYMGWNGSILVTYNAGVTWHVRTDLMDSAGLPKCTANADVNVLGNPIPCNPSNPIHGLPGTWAVFDATHPFSIGGTAVDSLIAETASSVQPLGPIGTNDGTYGGTGATNAIKAGDTLYFGCMGGIVIDTSEGSLANPGIALGDPGASGVASKLIYFGWSNGAASLFVSTNAGATISACGSGGPTNVDCKMKLSTDATLAGGGNNVLYVSTGFNTYWRWVRTPPTGSGLSANTWTSYAVSSVMSGFELSAFMMLPNPAAAGHVTFLNLRGNSNQATNYGDSLAAGGTSATVTCSGGDTTWLNADAPYLGDAAYDPVTANRIWFATGCGLYHCDMPNDSSGLTFVGKMQPGLQSMILSQVTKCAAPNGRMIITGQDRNLMFSTDENTQPLGWFFQPQVAPNTGWAAYGLDDPSVMYASVAEVYRTTDGINLTTIASPRFRNNPFATVSGSKTVTVTDPAHGQLTGSSIGFDHGFANFNNVTLSNLVFVITKIDADTYTVQSSTTANATGSGGGGSYIGSNGWTGGFFVALAAPTKRNVVAIGAADNLNRVQHGVTTDDVNWTWSQATFSGSPLTAAGPGTFQLITCVAAEKTTGKVAWMNTVPGITNTLSLFVSSDLGATYTCPGGTGTINSTWTGYPNFSISQAEGPQIASVSGNPTHWFVSQGNNNTLIAPYVTTQYLRRTRDDGVTWDNFDTNTNFVISVAVGPPKPGNSYCTVYIWGLANGDVVPNFGIYRCDDMTGGAGDMAGCTWTKLTNLSKVDCSGSRGGLYSNPDTYGTFYFVTPDNGYLVGSIT